MAYYILENPIETRHRELAWRLWLELKSKVAIDRKFLQRVLDHWGEDQVQKYLNAKHREEIIFTKSATESINLIASSFGEKFIKEGDEILFGKYSGTEISIDGEEMLVMREDDITAIITN